MRCQKSAHRMQGYRKRVYIARERSRALIRKAGGLYDYFREISDFYYCRLKNAEIFARLNIRQRFFFPFPFQDNKRLIFFNDEMFKWHIVRLRSEEISRLFIQRGCARFSDVRKDLSHKQRVPRSAEITKRRYSPRFRRRNANTNLVDTIPISVD